MLPALPLGRPSHRSGIHFSGRPVRRDVLQYLQLSTASMKPRWLASAKTALAKADGVWKFGLAAVGEKLSWLFFSVSTYQWARQEKLDKLEEQWSSISPATQEQLQLVRDFRRKHATADDPQHYADVMYEYYTALREGTGGAQPEHAPQVEKARRDQQVFWDKFLGRRHQWVPFLPLEFLGGFESMMPKREHLDTKQSRWSRRAGEYQKLFEPVDIANWYAKRIHEDEDGYGHYIDQLDRPGDANKRPGRFNRIDRHVKQKTIDEALAKAREYKQNYEDSGGKKVLVTKEPAHSKAWLWSSCSSTSNDS